MGTVVKNVTTFAMIGFLLLAVLFGMQIMTFIFGQFGDIDILTDNTNTVTNRTDTYINGSAYTIPEASDINFSGGFTVIVATNVSTPAEPIAILTNNFTVDAARGIIKNATAVGFFDEVNLTYSYTSKTFAESVSDDTKNYSLTSIGNYAAQSGTQFTTLGIAITLVILIAVFLFFWVAFIGKGGTGRASSSSRKSSSSLGGGQAFG